MVANSSAILPTNRRMTMDESCPALGKRAGWAGEVMAAGCGDAVGPVDLSIVDEGDNVVIGNRLSGVFVAVPPVGGVVVRAIQEGASVAEAAAAAEQFAGEPVNVAGFVDRLRQLGLIASPARAAMQLPRTAAIQQRRWLGGPAPERVAWLFGRAAWTVYACMAAFDVGVLVARPALFPHARAAYQLVHAGAGPSLVLLFPVATALAILHECGHWLAARAAGLRARFGIDHRMYFLVLETDLSQLWSLPRRRWFGPLLAGLAADATVLAVVLMTELGISERWWALPPFAAHLIAALAFVEAAAMTWQFLLFLRTDLYAVLAAATGCHNLWRVKTLSLRQALRTLTPAQARELSAARPRDLAVAAWFRWLWLAGFLLAASWFSWFGLPLFSHLLAWAVPGLATGPATTRFWLSAACAAILLWRYGIPALLTLGRAAAAIQARHAREPRGKGVDSWKSKSPASRRSRQQLKEARASESLVR